MIIYLMLKDSTLTEAIFVSNKMSHENSDYSK